MEIHFIRSESVCFWSVMGRHVRDGGRYFRVPRRRSVFHTWMDIGRWIREFEFDER